MMVLFMRSRRRVEQIAAQFADIDKDGGVVFVQVVPEFADRETLLDDQRAAAPQRQAHGADAAGGVIKRQGIIDAVAWRGFQRAPKAGHHKEQPHMAEIGGFGQAGGAGGINVKSAVLAGDAGARARTGRTGWSAIQREVEIVLLSLNPDLRLGVEKRLGLGQTGRQLLADNDMAGAHDLDGVGQWLAALVGVDQRGAQARLEQSQPGTEKIRAIVHEQRHGIALLQAQRQRPMGIGIGAGIQRPVAHHRVEIINRRRIGRFARPALDDIDDGAPGAGRHQPQHPHGAADAGEIRIFAPYRGDESHGVSLRPRLVRVDPPRKR